MQADAAETPQAVLAAITVLEAWKWGCQEEGWGEGMLSTGI